MTTAECRMTNDGRTTADGQPIMAGMTVYVWDDLPAVPRLDSYKSTGLGDDGVRLDGGDDVGCRRLRHALDHQCFADARDAVLKGFRQGVEELAEHGEMFSRPFRVCNRGICLPGRYCGAEHRRWFGGDRPDLAPYINKVVLVGRNAPSLAGGTSGGGGDSQVVIYDLAGEYICTAFPNHLGKEMDR